MKERPLIFGEVLFDCFPDGQSRLGGAPFNVAAHLEGLSLRPLMISRVGNDSQGAEVLAAMRHRGMDSSGIQIDSEKPTGAVQVDLGEAGPTFTILEEQAYDHMEVSGMEAAVSGRRFGLVYAGTLALRHPESRQAFQRLWDRVSAPLFVDLNLRDPWWDRELVAAQIDSATWLKLNQDELAVVLDRSAVQLDDFLARGPQWAVRMGVEMLAVTFGGEGAAIAVSDGGLVHGTPPPAERFVDSVGAGDAFAAMLIEGLLAGRSTQSLLKRALFLGSRVCGVQGALFPTQAVYREADDLGV